MWPHWPAPVSWGGWAWFEGQLCLLLTVRQFPHLYNGRPSCCETQTDVEKNNYSWCVTEFLGKSGQFLGAENRRKESWGAVPAMPQQEQGTGAVTLGHIRLGTGNPSQSWVFVSRGLPWAPPTLPTPSAAVNSELVHARLCLDDAILSRPHGPVLHGSVGNIYCFWPFSIFGWQNPSVPLGNHLSPGPHVPEGAVQARSGQPESGVSSGLGVGPKGLIRVNNCYNYRGKEICFFLTLLPKWAMSLELLLVLSATLGRAGLKMTPKPRKAEARDGDPRWRGLSSWKQQCLKPSVPPSFPDNTCSSCSR